MTTPTPDRPLVFAAPAYANSVPLTHCIPDVCPGARVVLDYPSRLIEPLRRSEFAAGLIPVAALFAEPEFVAIPGIGICAEKRVCSVLLRCRRPLAEIRTVELDSASRTSNALTRVLFQKHWCRPVRFVTAPTTTPADAAVVIGDRALCEPPGPAGDLDLAEQWHHLTGLPFVFAVWVHRRNHPKAVELARCVQAAKAAGVSLIPELARQQAEKLGLSLELCLDYFATCIYYDAGLREVQGLELFRQSVRELEAASV